MVNHMLSLFVMSLQFQLFPILIRRQDYGSNRPYLEVQFFKRMRF